MSRRFLKSLIACLLAISVSVGCTSFTNPATGGKHLLLVSRDTELGWGKQVYEGLKEKPGFTAPNQRVLDIGKRVVEACDDHTWEYHFEVLNTDVPNAFAAPGGFIFVTNGLLKMATTDDELAGVMAHEAGHIAAKHTAIRMQRAMIAQGLVVGSGNPHQYAPADQRRPPNRCKDRHLFLEKRFDEFREMAGVKSAMIRDGQCVNLRCNFINAL